jgi:trk system potassium uptake protein TrkH
MILMFIGASPGSTGGGIKTTTFAAVVMNLASIIRGKRSVVINLRQIPGEIVERAQVILAISLSLVLGAAFLLLTFGQGTFLAVLFESFSAVGTVGLSMGLTPQLTSAGRFVLIVAMFAGRLGPLTVATALAGPSHEGVRYPQERISVG